MSQRRLTLVAVSLVLVAAPAAFAHERLATHLGWRDGLPSAVITGMVQDETGFIWIGTDGGLVRYDGREMRVWSSRSASLALGSGPRDEVYFHDGDGLLWQVERDGAVRVAGPAGD